MQISFNGTDKQIKIERFKALDGWDMQRRFREFAASTDAAFRRAFTLEVLAYAKVVTGTGELPLSTGALIDNHLGTWENVQAVFEAVLNDNGINPKTHADNHEYWTKVGGEIAIAFLAECSKLMGPALDFANKAYSRE